MRKFLFAISLTLSVFTLMGKSYDEQMKQGEKLFKSKKF